MAWLLVLVLLAVLLVKSSRTSALEERVTKIEQYLMKESGGAASALLQNQEQQTAATPAPMEGSALSLSPSSTTDALAWLLTDWPMKAGALLILLAAGWFVSYAFSNNWIGEEGRIAIGILAGTAFMGAGYWRSIKETDQGVVLYLIGATTIDLTLFAARYAYDMFTATTVLGAMVLVSAALGAVSAQLKSFPLSAWGLFLAALAPFLVDAPTESTVGLILYSGIVATGTLALAVFTKWRKLLLLSIVPYALYSVIGMVEFQSFEQPALFLIANIFAILFALAGFWYSHALHSSGDGVYDLSTGALNAMVLFGWIMNSAPEGMDSLFCALWGLLFALSAFYLYSYRHELMPALVYGGLATLFIGIATALELDGPTLAIALALEGAVVAFGALQLCKHVGVGVWVGAVFVPSVMVSMVSVLSPAWEDGVLHQDAFVMLLMGALLACLAAFARELRASAPLPLREEYDSVFKVSAIGSCLYFLTFLWLATHALFDYDAATAIALAIYALIGIAAYFYAHSYAVRVCGGLLIGGVIARLLLVEVWQMDIAGRIITFFGIGALLLVATLTRKNTMAQQSQAPSLPKNDAAGL